MKKKIPSKSTPSVSPSLYEQVIPKQAGKYKPQDNIELKRDNYVTQNDLDVTRKTLMGLGRVSKDEATRCILGSVIEMLENLKPLPHLKDDNKTAGVLPDKASATLNEGGLVRRPSSKDDNKIRREAVEGLWRYLEKKGWISQQVTSDIVSSVVEEYLKKEESENI